jgi:hypothetical protein
MVEQHLSLNDAQRLKVLAKPLMTYYKNRGAISHASFFKHDVANEKVFDKSGRRHFSLDFVLSWC